MATLARPGRDSILLIKHTGRFIVSSSFPREILVPGSQSGHVKKERGYRSFNYDYPRMPSLATRVRYRSISRSRR